MSSNVATAASPSPDLFVLGRAAQAAARIATDGRGFFSCNPFIATSLPMLTEATGRGLRGLLRVALPAEEPAPQQERRLAALAEQVREGLVLDGVVPTPEEDCPGLATLLFVALCRLALAGVPHVLVDLDRLGPKLGQLALGFGADEILRVDRGRATPASGRKRRQPRRHARRGGPACARGRAARLRARGRRLAAGVRAVTLASISEKVGAGIPLSFDDGVALFREPDLLKLGALANQVRERRHGDRATFNRNLHINPTNLCVASCKLCSFSRRSPEQPGAFTLSLSQAWGKLKARIDAGRSSD